MPARIILAAGTGSLGTILATAFAQEGHDILILTRKTPTSSPHPRIRYAYWDARTVGPWARELGGATALINLAGRSVNCRYTPENRCEILESRVDSVHALAAALELTPNPPPVWIQAASAAIYGDAGDTPCTESTPPGEGFSPSVCQAWENAFWKSVIPGTRKVLLRIGFVLARDGGALQMLGNLTRLGLGGTVSHGRQYMSWLHETDFLNIVRAAMFPAVGDCSELDGIYNAVSPNPTRNRDFMRELRHALHRPWSPPVPAPLIRLGCLLMGTEAELALRGRYVLPTRLQNAGYAFRYPTLKEALAHIYETTPRGNLAPAAHENP